MSTTRRKGSIGFCQTSTSGHHRPMNADIAMFVTNPPKFSFDYSSFLCFFFEPSLAVDPLFFLAGYGLRLGFRSVLVARRRKNVRGFLAIFGVPELPQRGSTQEFTRFLSTVSSPRRATCCGVSFEAK